MGRKNLGILIDSTVEENKKNNNNSTVQRRKGRLKESYLPSISQLKHALKAVPIFLYLLSY